MGNQQLINYQDNDMLILQELCLLTQRSLNQKYSLSGDPFGPSSTSQNTYVFSDLAISNQMDQNEDTQPIQPMPNVQALEEANQRESMEQVQLMRSQIYKQSLQKNQNLKNTISKTKKIKKEIKQKKSKIKTDGMNTLEGEVCSDDIIRNQNNCKSYHKLVKNYLIQNNLQSMIKEYEDKYHTRYYFLVALIIIKYNLTSNFCPIYSKIVQDQVNFQKGKILRKQMEINHLNEKIKQLELKVQDTSKLEEKKAKLQNQIIHINDVIFEIQNYSKSSCQEYFNNETEKALHILYKKNDPVMRKKYYFDTAIEIIKDLQNKMREKVSHN